MLNKIVIASGNKGKLKEFDTLLHDFNIAVLSQSALSVPEADETGLSFIENAIIKARNASHYSGLPAIADDSGLAVDALNGEPGIRSARYSSDELGAQANDASNNAKLLAQLEGLPSDKRSARFICALVFMRHANDPTPIVAQGEWRGVILSEPRGDNGFGYDPLFFLPALEKTSAELDPSTKNRLSHRGQAMQLLAHQLKQAGYLDA